MTKRKIKLEDVKETIIENIKQYLYEDAEDKENIIKNLSKINIENNVDIISYYNDEDVSDELIKFIKIIKIDSTPINYITHQFEFLTPKDLITIVKNKNAMYSNEVDYVDTIIDNRN